MSEVVNTRTASIYIEWSGDEEAGRVLVNEALATIQRGFKNDTKINLVQLTGTIY